MTLIEEAIAGSMDIWKQYMTHPFIKDIRHNSMDKQMFIHYLIEDTVYLKAYAKVFGMGIYKSKTMDDIRLFYEMLKFVESDESAVRVTLLAKEGIDAKDIENKDPMKENEAYINFLLDTAKKDGLLEILFATLPCMLSYAYIGQELLKENPRILIENNYGDWIQEYVAEEYIAQCASWSKQVEAMCSSCNQQEKDHLKEIFRSASLHELYFWDMSYHK